MRHQSPQAYHALTRTFIKKQLNGVRREGNFAKAVRARTDLNIMSKEQILPMASTEIIPLPNAAGWDELREVKVEFGFTRNPYASFVA